MDTSSWTSSDWIAAAAIVVSTLSFLGNLWYTRRLFGISNTPVVHVWLEAVLLEGRADNVTLAWHTTFDLHTQNLSSSLSVSEVEVEVRLFIPQIDKIKKRAEDYPALKEGYPVLEPLEERSVKIGGERQRMSVEAYISDDYLEKLAGHFPMARASVNIRALYPVLARGENFSHIGQAVDAWNVLSNHSLMWILNVKYRPGLSNGKVRNFTQVYMMRPITIDGNVPGILREWRITPARFPRLTLLRYSRRKRLEA